MPKLRSRRKSSKRKSVRRKSVRKKSKSKRKTSKRVSRKRLSKLECLDLLKSKIGINMREFPNRKQAIAVSYSQVKKYQPSCSRFFK